MKIVINNCYGGYSLSEKACEFLGVADPYAFNDDRANEKLIECIETLGEESSDLCSDLQIIEIPDEVYFVINDNYGKEWVSEKHRTWRI